MKLLQGEAAAVKKKKKNRSKKKTSADVTKTVTAKGQTEPPTIPIVELFPDGKVGSDFFFMRGILLI